MWLDSSWLDDIKNGQQMASTSSRCHGSRLGKPMSRSGFLGAVKPKREKEDISLIISGITLKVGYNLLLETFLIKATFFFYLIYSCLLI